MERTLHLFTAEARDGLSRKQATYKYKTDHSPPTHTVGAHRRNCSFNKSSMPATGRLDPSTTTLLCAELNSAYLGILKCSRLGICWRRLRRSQGVHLPIMDHKFAIVRRYVAGPSFGPPFRFAPYEFCQTLLASNIIGNEKKAPCMHDKFMHNMDRHYGDRRDRAKVGESRSKSSLNPVVISSA